MKIDVKLNSLTFCTPGDEPPLSNSGPPELISASEFRPALSTQECLTSSIVMCKITFVAYGSNACC